MPKTAVPKYRRQREKSGDDRAFVVLSGRRVHLGPYGSEESRERYARVIAEWEAAGRREPVAKGEDITIVELAAAFLRHAEAYYRRADGTASEELHDFKPILALLRDLCGDTPAASFGPRCLKAIRQKLIERAGARGYVNSKTPGLRAHIGIDTPLPSPMPLGPLRPAERNRRTTAPERAECRSGLHSLGPSEPHGLAKQRASRRLC